MTIHNSTDWAQVERRARAFERERYFKLNARGGPAENPLGQYVCLAIKDRQYLGEVTDCYFNHVLGCVVLKVRHFNGEMWPFEPRYSAVTVLDYERNTQKP